MVAALPFRGGRGRNGLPNMQRLRVCSGQSFSGRTKVFYRKRKKKNPGCISQWWVYFVSIGYKLEYCFERGRNKYSR